jgi:hypothetical protein
MRGRALPFACIGRTSVTIKHTHIYTTYYCKISIYLEFVLILLVTKLSPACSFLENWDFLKVIR